MKKVPSKEKVEATTTALTPWRFKIQRRLRTAYTLLEHLREDEVVPNPAMHDILCDLDKVVQELKARTAAPRLDKKQEN